MYVPLALVIWGLMYNSGVHATIAGVAMGLMLRCTTREGEEHSPASTSSTWSAPSPAGVAVPLFALFSAGVGVSGKSLGDVFTQPVTLGVVLGLVVGKAVGIFGGTWLTARFTRAELNPDLSWPDVFALATLAGIGFTVSLLIGELAFAGDPALTSQVKAAVLTGSLVAAVLATVLLKLRVRKYDALYADEERDEDETASRTSTRRTARNTTSGWPRSTRGRPPNTDSAPNWRGHRARRPTVRHDLSRTVDEEREQR